MTTRAAAAWDRIRAADPMASIDVTGASEALPVQELLHRIVTDVSKPAMDTGVDTDIDVLTLLDVGLDRVLPTRRRGLAAGVAAAVVVLLAAVTVVAVHRKHPAAAPSARQQKTAAGYSKALLAELPLPPGAKRVDRSPIPELTQSAASGNGILDAQVGWWTVPGSFAAAVDRMGQAGARPAYWTSRVGSTGIAGARSNGRLIEVRDPGSRFVSSINVVVAADGTDVAMRAEVDTYSALIRTPDQVIPDTIGSATFSLSGPASGGGNSSRLIGVTSPRVAALARHINATPTYVVLSQAKCPAPHGSITVTFRSGNRRWVLDISDISSLCGSPTLAGADHKSVALTPSTTLLGDVLAAAGLPSDYFNR